MVFLAKGETFGLAGIKKHCGGGHGIRWYSVGFLMPSGSPPLVVNSACSSDLG